MSEQPAKQILTIDSIRLGQRSTDKFTAIRQTGDLLVSRGCVSPEYVDSMVAREQEVSIYMGNGLALPHCTNEGRGYILQSGIVVFQYPEGIDFGGEKAHILIGIAGAGEDHLAILQNVAMTFMDCDEATLHKLFTTDDIQFVYNLLMPKA
ncbi:MAG: PTS sugar transporter subunit IIA [Eubacteriales bacterium]|nr:PTS sugar transporter subunit IIA [Eubacteriales bacterium]